MTEQEESEFHKVWDKLCDDGYRSSYEAARHCWYTAKRSQPVVDIPAIGKTDHASAAFYACKIFQALTDAGIQYRIKGE